jgi:hypothetical protein
VFTPHQAQAESTDLPMDLTALKEKCHKLLWSLFREEPYAQAPEILGLMIDAAGCKDLAELEAMYGKEKVKGLYKNVSRC